MEIILNPIAAWLNTLTPVPGARANWQCVKDYPENLERESYVYAENANRTDVYLMANIQATQQIEINSVSVRGVCERENDTQVCTVELRIVPFMVVVDGPMKTLEPRMKEYIATWKINPETDSEWTIGNVNTAGAGVVLRSAGAGCEARCTQLYMSANISVKGKILSNDAPGHKETIYINEGYSVIAQEEKGRELFGGTTMQIRYKDPDGMIGSITGNIVDRNKILAPVAPGLNIKTGKWWFKLYAVLASGEILEGKPFGVNVQSKWL